MVTSQSTSKLLVLAAARAGARCQAPVWLERESPFTPFGIEAKGVSSGEELP
jgi:hypothetical protein